MLILCFLNKFNRRYAEVSFSYISESQKEADEHNVPSSSAVVSGSSDTTSSNNQLSSATNLLVQQLPKSINVSTIATSSPIKSVDLPSPSYINAPEEQDTLATPETENKDKDSDYEQVSSIMSSDALEDLRSISSNDNNSNDVDVTTGDVSLSNDDTKRVKSNKSDVEIKGPDGPVYISIVSKNEEKSVVQSKQLVNEKLDASIEKTSVSDDKNVNNYKKLCFSAETPFKRKSSGKKLSTHSYKMRLKRKTKSKRNEIARRRWLAREKKLLFNGLDTPLEPSISRGEKQQQSELDPLDCDPLNVDTLETENNRASDDRDNASDEDINVERGNDTSYSARVSRQKIGIFARSSRSSDKPPSSFEKPCIISPLALYSLPPMTKREKQTRNTLPLTDKIKVIEAFLDGKSQRMIARMHKIGKTQVSGIIRRREEILAYYRENVVNGETSKKLSVKRQRKSEYALLNDHLMRWYKHVSGSNTRITTGMLRAKALQIAPQLGYHEFKASNGWLAHFKGHNNLKFSKVSPSSSDPPLQQATVTDTSYYHETLHHHQEEEEDSLMPEECPPAPTGFLTNPGLLQGAAAAILKCGGNQNMGRPGNGQTMANHLPPPGQLEAFHHHLGRTGGVVDHHNPHHPPPPTASSLLSSKTDSILAYKTEDAPHLTGYPPTYDPHHQLPPRMGPDQVASVAAGPLAATTSSSVAAAAVAAAARTSEYNYAPYTFPSGYYGYHFLGQY